MLIRNDILQSIFWFSPPGRALNPNEVIYSETALTTATTVSALIALVIGLVAGALLQRKFSKDGYRNCGHHYLEQQAHLNK